MAHAVRLRNIKRALKLEPSETINYLISGRVSNFRVYKSMNFIDLTDGSTPRHLQLVVRKELLKKPELGSYLICQGNIVSSKGQQQRTEFKVNGVDLASECNAEKWPLASAKHNKNPDSWYRKHLHLRPQADHFAALLRVRSELELSLHMIFKQMDFFKVHTPILSSNDSEASSDLFKVHRMGKTSSATDGDNHDEDDGDYFHRDVFMVSSAQLHLECLAASLSRVYCLSSAFRAEKSLSRHHLCEFNMLEAEEANLTSLEPLMDRVESIVKFSAQFISDISEFSEDFRTLLDKYSNYEVCERLANSKYIRITYEEAIKVLQALHSQPKTVSSGLLSDLPLSACQYGCDMSRRHERHLLNYFNQVPIFITNYPKLLKPFYMKCSEGGKEALCFDLIAPFGGEICGGSLREDNLDRLCEALRSTNSPIQRDSPTWKGEEEEEEEEDKRRRGEPLDAGEAFRDFQWYLDLREFGTFPHGGFGLGFERLIQSLLGIRNIRDTIAFPRWSGSCRM